MFIFLKLLDDPEIQSNFFVQTQRADPSHYGLLQAGNSRRFSGELREETAEIRDEIYENSDLDTFSMLFYKQKMLPDLPAETSKSLAAWTCRKLSDFDDFLRSRNNRSHFHG